ncbi:MAG: hypothetical protein WC375_00180 [Methanomassiliicoccales archaeon]|jgi:hypothetical protein
MATRDIESLTYANSLWEKMGPMALPWVQANIQDKQVAIYLLVILTCKTGEPLVEKMEADNEEKQCKI